MNTEKRLDNSAGNQAEASFCRTSADDFLLGESVQDSASAKSHKKNGVDIPVDFAKSFLNDLGCGRELARVFLPKKAHKNLDFDNISMGDIGLGAGGGPNLTADAQYLIPLKNKRFGFTLASVLVEHKSYPYRWLAADAAAYAALVMRSRYRKDLRNRRQARKTAKQNGTPLDERFNAPVYLSPAVVIVLYNGKRPLKRPVSLRRLYPPKNGLEKWLLHLRLITIDLNQIDLSKIDFDPNQPKVRIGLETLQRIVQPNVDQSIRNLLDQIVAYQNSFISQTDCQEFGQKVIEYLGNKLAKDSKELLNDYYKEFRSKMKIETMQGATLALYQDGWQKGEAAGWQKGEAAGWQKGEAAGWQKGEAAGWQKGLNEGQQALANSLLRVLDKRFPGCVSDVLRLRIKEINDLTVLQNLLDIALDCKSVDVIEERV